MKWLLLALILLLPPGASAQFNGCSAGFCAPASTTVAPYQGPGDIVSGALVWYSCSRVYNAAAASTATNLCDLKDSSTGTVAICTLRGSSTGFADQSAYCAGALTPSAACLAAAGGSCKVSKMYNQVTPGTLDVVQATAASMPAIVFSSTPTGTLPAINCVPVTSNVLATASNPAISTTYSISAVTYRTNGSTANGFIASAANSTTNYMGADAANTVGLAASAKITNSATDATWHSLAGVVNGASSFITVDTTDNSTQNAGSSAWGANPLRVCRQGSGGTTYTGLIAEVGLWSGVVFTSGAGNQTQKLEANQHSAINGYNF
jgi:hypothetical protein